MCGYGLVPPVFFIQSTLPPSPNIDLPLNKVPYLHKTSAHRGLYQQQ